jgi:Uma2 family endonuclease
MNPNVENKQFLVQEPPADFNVGYTYAEYLHFNIEERLEIIRGKIFKMSPAPSSIHQKVSQNINGQIWNHLRGKPCQVFCAPFDVILPVENRRRNDSNTVVQPDICIICKPELIEENGCFGAPDWIIEILSPHTSKKDIQLKYEVYEEAGVKEYWIVMPEEKLVEVFVLVENKYTRIQTYVREDMVPSATLPNLHVDLMQVF